jgi:chromosome segregation ATPase
MKPAIFALVVACLGLTAGLIIFRQKTESRVKTAEAQSARATAEIEEAKAKFTDLEKLYTIQEGTLSMRNEELAVASNSLTRVATELKTLEGEMVKRGDRIAALQSERDDLAADMSQLNESIDKLEKEIGTTKKKLETAEGDKNFLLGELKRLQTERETLVRQFNDLASLRIQVAKLKEETAIKRRLEWKRAGVYALHEQKGAERLTAKPWVMAKADNDLNADVYQDNRPLSPKATKDVLDGSTSVQPAESP